jgi:hypothetical protein
VRRGVRGSIEKVMMLSWLCTRRGRGGGGGGWNLTSSGDGDGGGASILSFSE